MFKSVKHYGANAVEIDGVLVSYDTPVCAVRGGDFVRLWNGWSATTGRHINMFRAEHCMPSITKSQWQKMEVQS